MLSYRHPDPQVSLWVNPPYPVDPFPSMDLQCISCFLQKDILSLIQESTCRRLTICFKSRTNNRFTGNTYLQLLTNCFCSLVSINKTQINCNYSILRIRVYVLFVCRAAIVMAPIPWKKHANKSLCAFSVLHYTLLHSVHCLHKTREFILLAAFS